MLDIIYRDSTSEIQVSSGKVLMMGKLQEKDVKDEERITGNYYQNVNTVLHKFEKVLPEVRTITVQYLFPSLVLCVLQQ
jgi:hypothetical protein